MGHVVQFVDPAHGVTKTMVIGNKQLAKNGSTALDPNAAGSAMPLSDASLQTIVDRLNGTVAADAVENAMRDGTLIKAVAYVDKSTGKLMIVRVT